MILVKNGKTEEVAKQVYQKFENILFTSWRINTIANLVAQVYYPDSLALKEMIEGILALDNVERVEFSEYVEVVDRKSYEEVEKNIAKHSRS